MKAPHFLASVVVLALVSLVSASAQLVFPAKDGPGRGKQVVLLAGDEEYRSEEGLPMLAKLLSQRHGFKCTVVFPINPADGTIDPNNQSNLPGLEALDSADCAVVLWRFRNPDDAGMAHFEKYFLAGKPIIALRTSTHAFNLKDPASRFAKWDWQGKAPWVGGFGQQVLGETWVSHHGNHGSESTRGIIEPAARENVLLRGVSDLWGPTDVYGVTHLPADARVLVRGQVVAGMKPTDPPLEGPKNTPMMPLVWTRVYKNDAGTTNKILTTTMGAATDLENEGLRRLVVNAVFSFTGLEVPAKADVTLVGDYKPTGFGFNKFVKGVKPEQHALKE